MKTKSNELKKVFLALLSLTAFTASAPAFCAAEGLNIGALIGLDFLSGGGAASASNLGYGARLGYHMDPNWELGAAFTTTTNSTAVGQFNTSSSLGLLMGELNYHLPGNLNPLSFGFRLGIGFNSGSSNDPAITSRSSTNLAYGLVGGYDFLVSRNFSIGPRVSYTTVNQDAGPNQGDFQAQAAFKYYLY
jgi:opacity protein-like surface antigen